MSQTIFITGSSTGLGRAAAILFASRGWRVIATMRRPENETELGNLPGITVLPLDVTDLAQIETASRAGNRTRRRGRAVQQRWLRAGRASRRGDRREAHPRDRHETARCHPDEHRRFFRTSGKERPDSSSRPRPIGGLMAFPFNSVYHATKWAIEGWSESMAFELAPFNIGIKTVSPGGISTDFAGRSLDLVSHPAYEELMKKVLAVFMDPERAAQASSARTDRRSRL